MIKCPTLFVLTVLVVSLILSFVEYSFDFSFTRKLFAVSPALVAIVISYFDKSRPLGKLGWKINPHYWLKITLWIGLAVICLLTVAWLAGHFEFNEKALKKFLRIETISALVLGVIINTGEEAGWRGYLFPSLVRERGWWKAVVTTTFVWWLWHVPFMAVLQIKMFGQIQYTTQLIQLLGLFPVSILFGVWMKDSNSFWAIGYAHQLINFVNKWFFGLEHSEKLPLFFTDKSYARIYSTENGILGFAVISLLALCIYFYTKRNNSQLLSA